MVSIPFFFGDEGGSTKGFVSVIAEVLVGSKVPESSLRRICGLMIRFRWKEKKLQK